jgi:hypothetical protein
MQSLLEILPASSALESWQAMTVDGVLKATLLIAVATVAGALLWRASASTRHLVWTSALAGTLAIPLLMLTLPSWRVPIPPAARVPGRGGREQRASGRPSQAEGNDLFLGEIAE